MKKKEFTAAALNLEYETYVVYVISFGFSPFVVSSSSTLLNIHPFWRPYISGLITEEAPTKVPNEYADFVDVFSLDLAFELLKYIKINDYAIKLIVG